MKNVLSLLLILVAFISCCNNENPVDYKSLTAQLNVFMDHWHHSAAVADEDVFFGSLDSNAVYLGTDPKERWSKQEFMDWGMKYFQRDTAWAFYPFNRHWEISNDGNIAWFDELLETHMGVCRGSGVVIKKDNRWKIKQYNLAVTIANEKMSEFKRLNETNRNLY